MAPVGFQTLVRTVPVVAGRRWLSPGAETRFLALLGLAAGWLAAVTQAENANAEGYVDFEAVQPALYHLAHGTALLAVLAAGLLSLVSGRYRIVGLGTRVAFCLLSATALIWAGMAYTPAEIFSTQILGAAGPFVWLSCLFVFAGTDRRSAPAQDALVRFLAYATAALAVRTLLTSSAPEYNMGLSKHTIYVMMLMWLGGWTLLSSTEVRGWRLLARAAPWLTMLPLAVTSNSRSWTLQSLLLGVTFLALIIRIRKETAAKSIARVMVFSAVAVVTAGIVLLRFPTAMDNLMGRLGEDTRSGQYEDFFADVRPSELILGRGPKGTWYWALAGDYQGIDNGYLWMLFIGGIPTMLPYVVIVLWPAIRVLRLRPKGPDGAAAYMLLFWGIALVGVSTFSVPTLSINSYALLLWAGRCHLLLAKRGAARSNGPIGRIHNESECGQHGSDRE